MHFSIAHPRGRRGSAFAGVVVGLIVTALGADAAHALHAEPPTSDPDKPAFDLSAHRGGIGLNVESTPQAFAYALELGVSSLELDVQITEDGYAVITHDRKTNTSVCQEGEPAFEGDPEYPYMGKYIKELTLAQVRTFDCGSTTKSQYPGQVPHPGEPMMLLTEVFDLVKQYGAYDVDLNIETKVEAGAPHETAPREQFVQIVAADVRASGLQDQVMIQSFDWGAIMRMREVYPELRISALTNGQQFLQEGVPGPSPWLGGIDIDDFDGDPVAAVASFGADVLSPVHGDPQGGTIADPDYVPFTTAELVDHAHANGIRVIPWTVNDTATMSHLIDIRVDGIITDYPNLLHAELVRRGYVMPPPLARLDVAAGTVAIIGEPRVGSVLETAADGWSTAGFAPAFQWMRDDQAIEGATAERYTPTDEDLATHLTVAVRLEVPGFDPIEVTSEPVGPVLAASGPEEPEPERPEPEQPDTPGGTGQDQVDGTVESSSDKTLATTGASWERILPLLWLSLTALVIGAALRLAPRRRT